MKTKIDHNNTDIYYKDKHRRLVRPAADDDFVICRNARMDMCMCYQVDV